MLRQVISVLYFLIFCCLAFVFEAQAGEENIKSEYSFILTGGQDSIRPSVRAMVRTTSIIPGRPARDNSKLYGGGKEDGFSMSSSHNVGVIPLKTEINLCEGEDAVLEVMPLYVSEVVTYQWYKRVAGVDSKCEDAIERKFELLNCTEATSGTYFCVVTDPNSGHSQLSDSIHLNVTHNPRFYFSGLSANDTICYGEEIELKVTTPLADKAGDYQYSWKGKYIQGKSDTASLKICPLESADYVLTVTYKGCSVYDILPLKVRRTRIGVPSSIVTDFNEEVQIVADKSRAGSIKWYIDKTEKGSRDTLTASFTNSSMFVAELNDGTCTVRDTGYVYLRDTITSYGGNGDGFSESNPGFTLPEPIYEDTVCERSTAMIELRIDGGEFYTYEWRKVEDGDSVYSRERILKIPNVQLENTGRYWCQVKDRYGMQNSTLELPLTVVHTPEVIINSPENEHQICVGEEIELDASDTELGNTNNKYTYTYLWSGNKLVSSRSEAKVVAAPDENTLYEVTVSNEKCSEKKNVYIKVKKEFFKVPDFIYASDPQLVEIEGKKDFTGTTYWTVNGKTDTTEVFKHYFKNTTKVYVEYKYNECSVFDTTTVFVRDSVSFMGTEGDGYAESNASFNLVPITDTTFCERSLAMVELKLMGSESYSYAWKKENQDSIYGHERILVFDSIQLRDAGRYYCVVTDNMSGKKDSVNMFNIHVIHTPRTVINSPENGFEMCYSHPVTISAENTELGNADHAYTYDYSWRGERITTDPHAKTIVVNPYSDAIYEVSVGNEGCYEKASIAIYVKRYPFAIPDVVQADASGMCEIIPDKQWKGDSTVWKIEGREFKMDTFNKKVLQTEQLTVIYANNGCTILDTALIFVRNDSVMFRGTRYDGFAESNAGFNLLTVRYDTNFCERSVATLEVPLEGNEVYNYEWRKRENEDSVYSRERILVLKNLKLEDEGTYYCIVTDPQKGQKQTTGECPLYVRHTPIVKVKALDPDFRLCRGEEITLDASDTEIGNINHDVYVYSWSGDKIINGKNQALLTVAPQADAYYELIVSNGKCFETASVEIAVQQESFSVPDFVNVDETNEVSILPEKAEKGDSTIWRWGGNKVIGDELRTQLSEYTKVYVEYVNKGCSVFDTCDVFVRLPEAYRNVEGDGYAESNSELNFIGIFGDTAVCERSKMVWDLRIEGSEVYEYEWRKKEDPSWVCRTRQLVIDTVKMSDAGTYICTITDVKNKKYSVRTGEQVLSVRHTPHARINGFDPAVVNTTEMCYNTLYPLSASDSETGKPDNVTYNYYWSGDRIKSSPLEAEVKVAPKKNTTYEVKVAAGNCYETAFVNVNVKREEISIPSKIELEAVRELQLEAEVTKEEGISWKLDGVSAGTGKVFNGLIEKNRSLVTVELAFDECVVSDSCDIFVRNGSQYKGGFGDGYDETKANLFDVYVVCDSVICEGTIARFEVINNGLETYTYKWRKAKSDNILNSKSVRVLEIPNVKVADSDEYYCIVTNVRTGEEKVTARVRMKVLSMPQAEIGSPERYFKACYGDIVTLSALQTELNKADASEVYTYRWYGNRILEGENEYEAKVQPKASATYAVEVSHGICSSWDTVEIEVIRANIKLPEKIELEAPGEVEITPQLSLNLPITWYTNGNIYGDDNLVFRENISRNTLVKAEIKTSTGCTFSDSTRVFVREPIVARGTKADGFADSRLNYNVRVEYTPEVCEGADASFKAIADVDEAYRYEWRKAGSDDILSEESELFLANTTLGDTGSYYCQVICLNTNDVVTTEPATLKVNESPKIEFNTVAGNICCFGEVVDIDTREISTFNRGYNYEWSGPAIVGYKNDKRTIQIRPEEKSDYTLYLTNDANCSSVYYITMDVHKIDISLQKTFLVTQGEDLSIKVEAPHGVKINWWGGDIYYPDRNPLILKEIDQSVPVTVEVSDELCTVRDSASVFIRMKRFYGGGFNDGYVESAPVPKIIKENEPVLGCELAATDSVVLFVVVEKNEPDLEYVWQKYNHSLSKFEDIPEPVASNITGVHSSRLKFDPLNTEDEGIYRCLVSNKYGSTESSQTEVMKGGLPQIDTHLERMVEMCLGEPEYTFSIEASVPGGNKPSYKWYKSDAYKNFKQLEPVKSFDTTALRLQDLRESDEAYYMVEAYNACGSVYDTGYLDVLDAPVILAQSQDTIICYGTELKLTVNVEGGGLMWYRLVKVEKQADNSWKEIEEVQVAGNSDTYLLGNAGLEDSGIYMWEIWSKCTESKKVRSKPIYVTVEEPLSVTYQKIDTSVCSGGDIVLSFESAFELEGNHLEVYWEKDGIALTLPEKADPRYYSIKSAQGNNGGKYICYVKNSCIDAVKLGEINLQIRNVPAILKQPALADSYCEGSEFTLETKINVNAGVGEWKWFLEKDGYAEQIFDEPGRISGTDTAYLKISSLLERDGGVYYMTAENQCGKITTKKVTLNVTPKPKFLADGRLKDTVDLCSGSNVTLRVNAVNNNSTYAWYAGNKKVAGHSGNMLEVADVKNSVSYSCVVEGLCGSDTTSTVLSVMNTISYRLGGGGGYCANLPEEQAGKEFSLDGSESGVLYKLYSWDYKGGYRTLIDSLRGTGDPLTFKKCTVKAGEKAVYYVVAVKEKSGTECNFDMKDSVYLQQYPALVKYELSVERYLCKGEYSATVKLSGSEDNPEIQYVLQQYNETTGEWVVYSGEIITGNGQPLTWEVSKGKYRVLAKNTRTDCEEIMKNEVVLEEKPAPDLVQLVALNNDTISCKGSVSDVVLSVDSPQDGCTYILQKDKEEGVKIDHAPFQWRELTQGIYTLYAENEWGCRVNCGRRKVLEKDPPFQYTLTGNAYFCEGEIMDRTLVLSGSDLGVVYKLFSGNNQSSVKQTADGTGDPLTFEVASTAAEYAVLAVDTATKCEMLMDGKVTLLPSVLHVKADQNPITIEPNNEVQLNITITGAVKPPVISWIPEGMLKTGEAAKEDPYTKPLVSGQQFTVTVTDTAAGCSQTGSVNVIIDGEPLIAGISKPDGTELGETVMACKGETLILKANPKGGNGIYTYYWKKTDGTFLGADGTCKIVLKPEDRDFDIALEIESSTQKDTAYLHVILWDVPKKPVITDESTICAGLGENVDIHVSGLVPDQVYTLEYSPNNVVYTPVPGQSIQTTDNTDYTFTVVFNGDAGGYYRVKAESTNGEITCSSFSDKAVRLREGGQKFVVSGDKRLCGENPDPDTVRLSGSLDHVAYVLWKMGENGTAQMMDRLDGSGNEIEFTGIYGSGAYRVVAENGVCRDTMDGQALLQYNYKPGIGEFIGGGIQCAYEVKEVGVSKAEKDVRYILVKTQEGGDLHVDTVVGEGRLVFDRFDNTVGYYYITAVDMRAGCQNTYNGLTINPAAKNVSSLVGGPYCGIDGKTKVNFKIFDTEEVIRYDLYRMNGGKIASLNQRNLDTLYYQGTLEAGEYVVKGMFPAGCVRNVDTLTVELKSAPEIAGLVGAGEHCLGDIYEIGVIGTLEGVTYELVWDNLGEQKLVDTKIGVGRLIFDHTDKPGDYYVIGKDAEGCSAVYDTVTVKKAPKTVNFKGDGLLCESDGKVEVEFKAFPVETEYVYELCRVDGSSRDTLSGLNNDTLYLRKAIVPGEYILKAHAENSCEKVVAEGISFQGKPSPIMKRFSGSGDYCVAGAPIAVSIILNQDADGENVKYEFFRDSLGTKELLGTKYYTADLYIPFKPVEKNGLYYIMATDTVNHCVSRFDSIRIANKPELAKVGGSGTYCEGEFAVAKLYKVADPFMNYEVYKGFASEVNLVGRFGGFKKDTMYLEHNLPEGDYVVKTNVNGCANVEMQDTLKIRRQPLPSVHDKIGSGTYCYHEAPVAMGFDGGQENVKYVLYRDSVDVENIVMAESAGIGKVIFGEFDRPGTYHIYAKDTVVGCEQSFDGGVIKSTTDSVDYSGAGYYCEGEAIEIKMWPARKDVHYLLTQADGVQTYEFTTLDKDTLHYVGDVESGIYVVTGILKNGCEDTLTNKFNIGTSQWPEENIMKVTGTYCQHAVPQIVVDGALADVEYILCRDSMNVLGVEMETQTGVGSLTFNKQEAIGRYYVKARRTGQKCDITLPGELWVNESPKVLTLEGKAAMCEEDNLAEVRLIGYKTQKSASYTLKDINNGTLIDLSGSIVNDTIRYSSKLPESQYVVIATMNVQGACVLEMKDTIKVIKGSAPALKQLLAPLTACENANLEMGVAGSDAGVIYEVYRKEESGNDILVASKEGTDSDLIIDTAEMAGTYYVRAVGESGCAVILTEEYVATPKALQFEITGEKLYCAEEGGVQVGLSGTEGGVTYTIEHLDETTGEFGEGIDMVGLGPKDGADRTQWFPLLYSAGTYRIKADRCNTLIGEAFTIEEVESLEEFDIQREGNGCVDSTMVVIVPNSLADVEYTLVNADGTEADFDTLTGNGGELRWNVTSTEKKIYKVKADRKGCAVFASVDVAIETLPALGVVEGNTPAICQGSVKELIQITGFDANTKYQLLDSIGQNVVQVVEKGASKVEFTNLPAGTYFYKATVGMCDNISPYFHIDSIIAPEITDEMYDVAACAEENQGTIQMRGLNASCSYVVRNLQNKVVVNLANFVGDTLISKLPFNTYCLTVKDRTNNCESESVCKLINPAAAEDSIGVVPAYCIGGKGVKLELSFSSPYNDYTLLDADGKELQTISYPTLLFDSIYAKGVYQLKKERTGYLGGCISIDTFEIEELQKPLTDIIVRAEGGTALCAGGSYQVVLVNPQLGVQYFLRSAGSEVNLDTLVGNDVGNQNFKKVLTAAGSYNIYAQIIQDCGVYLDGTVTINELPSQITATGSAYCYPYDSLPSAGSGQISVIGLNSKVRYILTDGTNRLDSIMEGSSQRSFLGHQAGSYKVLGYDVKTGCIGEVSQATITGNKNPKIFKAQCDDGRKVGANAIIGLNGSETGVEYYLYRDGELVDGPRQGTNGAISFTNRQTVAGEYRISAKRKNTDCSEMMADSVIIIPGLESCDPIISGLYCEGTEAGVTITYPCGVAEWKYYLNQNGVSTDTIAGNAEKIEWTSIAQKPLLASRYELRAINDGGADILVKEVQVKALPVADLQKVKGEEIVKLCRGEEYEVILDSSQIGVSYDLKVKTESGIVEPYSTLLGTNDTLSFGKQTLAGEYYIYATVDSSQCQNIVDTLTIMFKNTPPVRELIAEDICRSTDPDAKLVVELKDKDVNESYYLKVNGVYVDSIVSVIFGGPVLDINRKEFKPQTTVGHYYVEAKNDICSAIFPAARVGVTPTSFKIEGTSDTTVCEGTKLPFVLEGSEEDVDYYFLKDNMVVGDSLSGTGEVLIFDEVYENGVYRVRAYNGCEWISEDSLKLTIKPLPALALQAKELSFCEGTPGPHIGVSSSDPDVLYSLYYGDKATPELIAFGNSDGSGFEFMKSGVAYESKAGEYRVVASNTAEGCSKVDTVTVTEIKLPQDVKFAPAGTGYLCAESCDKIVLDTTYENVDYTLVHELNGLKDTVTTVRGNGTKMYFDKEVCALGKYYVYGTMGGCKRDLSGSVTLSSPGDITKYKVVALDTAYCSTKSPSGSLKLSGASQGVRYTLKLNGIPTEQTRMYENGVIPQWNGLEGAACAGKDKEGNVYTVMAYDTLTGCTLDMEGTVYVVRQTAVSGITTSADIEDCEGGDKRLEVTAQGCGLEYEWVRGNDTVKKRSSENFLTFEGITPEANGVYICNVYNSCGKVSTKPGIQVFIKNAVTLDGYMPDQMICTKSAEKIEMRSTAQNATSYEWYRVGETTPLGSTTNVLVLTNVTSKDAGSYVCVASNDCGTVKDTCKLQFNSPPEITCTLPLLDTICDGSPLTLEINTKDSVEWYFNGEATGVKGNAYVINRVSATTHQEGKFTVKVTNVCQEKMFDVTTLLVDKQFYISKVTTSGLHYCEGSDVKLNVDAVSSTGRLSYVWKRDEDVVSDSAICNIPHISTEENKKIYTVTVSNKCNQLSKEVEVLVDPKLEFSLPEGPVRMCAREGADTLLAIISAKDLNGDYEWYYQQNSGDELTVLPTDNDTLHFALSPENSGYYSCKVTNVCGEKTSELTRVVVRSVPQITDFSKDTVICIEDPLEVYIETQGGELTYEWYGQRTNQTDSILFSREVKDEYASRSKISLDRMTDNENGMKIWCVLKNGCGEVHSRKMNIKVRQKSILSVSPTVASICPENELEVIVKLIDGVEPWNYTVTSQNDGTSVEHTAQYASDTLIIKDPGNYTISGLTANMHCIDNTQSIDVTVNRRDPFAAVLSGDTTVCLGQKAYLRLKVTDGTSPWRVKINRTSDNEIADEINASDFKLYGRDTLIEFLPTKDETYYLALVEEATEGVACKGSVSGTANVRVKSPENLSLKVLTRDRFGMCEDVVLYDLLQPSIAGGTFTIDGRVVMNLPKESGRDSIVYTVIDAGGCTSQRSVVVNVDTLPSASLDLFEENICPGEKTTLQIKLTGKAPYKLAYDIRQVNYSGAEITQTPNINVNKNPLELSVVYNASAADSMRTFSIVSVTDAYGCQTEYKAENKPQKTVYMRRRPQITVEGRSAYIKDFTSDIAEFFIGENQSVDFKVKLKSGTLPWNLQVLRTYNDLTTIPVDHSDIATKEKNFQAKEQGLYTFKASDKYCAINTTPVIARKITYQATGYVQLKVVLEGAYNASLGYMESHIQPYMPKNGLASWPVEESRIIDWVEVEFRKTLDSKALVKGDYLLLDDGTVVDKEGSPILAVTSQELDMTKNDWYIVINHRNHLSIATIKPESLSPDKAGVKLIDLTSIRNVYSKDEAYQLHMTSLGGIWGMTAGNNKLNALMSIANPNQAKWVDGSETTTPGYYLSDVNFDGIVNWPESLSLEDIGEMQLKGNSEDAWIMYKNREKYSEVPFTDTTK